MSLALLALLDLAAAADGFWHPNDLMAESRVFARLNDGAMTTFEERTRRSDELAAALRQYGLALDLLGARAPVEDRARLDELERQFHREKAVLEAFAQALIEDVDGAFYGAVERALPAIGSVVECEREIATGPQVPGMRARTSKNPACQGEDVNARLAAAIDADPALAKDVDEILALTWPAFTLASEARPAVGGQGSWLSVTAVFRKGAPDALGRIDQADEDARLPFQSAIEEGADQAALERLAKEAAAIDARTASTRAQLAAPVLEAIDKLLAKRGDGVGWCANPAALGGCEGDDATAATLEELLDDARVEKSLKKAASSIGG